MNYSRLILLLAFLPIASCAILAQSADRVIPSPVAFAVQPFDVLSYDADLDMRSAPAREMSGLCRITIHWRGEPSDGPFYFHLRGLVIDSVFYNDERVMPITEGSPDDATYAHRVDAPISVVRGDTDVVTVYYSGTMLPEQGANAFGGVHRSNDILYAIGVGFSNNYVSTTQHWLPCYDHPSDKATFHGRFLVKSGMTVASNGLVTVEPRPLDSITIFDWRTDIPTASYLLTFAVGPYVELRVAETPVPMVLYAKPIDTARTRTTFKLLPFMVEGFVRRFGAYPFEKVGYVNTTIGAMEHQTMISFPTSISQRRDTVNPVGAHELAHQWFGDFVSPTDFRHAWLNESFATWCESVWYEELRDFTDYIESQEDLLNEYLGTTQQSEGILPLYDFPRESPSSNYPRTIYNKGAVVVGMLRYELGDSLFYGALRSYLARYAYANATTDNLIEILEEYTGRNLDWFFDQWVYRAGWPQVSLRSRAEPIGAGLQSVVIDFTQTPIGTDSPFVNVPIEIGFRGPNGDFVYRVARMNGISSSVTFDSIPDFTAITVNRGPSLRALVRVGDVSGVPVESGKSDQSGFVISPNIVYGSDPPTVSIYGMEQCEKIAYEVFDGTGSRVGSGNTEGCDFELPVERLDSGRYVVRVTMNGVMWESLLTVVR